MYHNIADRPRFYSSLADEFVEQMEVLDGLGVRVLSVGHYLDELERGAADGPAVTLTFDDAYTSFGEFALPVLERFGYPATVFVPVDHIGASNQWDTAADPEHFRIADAAELQAWQRHPLVTLGSHGLSHRSLGQAEGEALEREMCGSKRALEDLLGTQIDCFAYPYGQRADLPAAGPAMLARCGYRAAFTTVWTRHPDPSRPYALGRLEITAGDDARQFRRKLFGWPDTWRLRQAVRTFRGLFR